jgi:hypothetical protein
LRASDDDSDRSRSQRLMVRTRNLQKSQFWHSFDQFSTTVFSLILGSRSPSNGTHTLKMSSTDHPGTGVWPDPELRFAMSESTPASAIIWAWGGSRQAKTGQNRSEPVRTPWRGLRTVCLDRLLNGVVHTDLAGWLIGPDWF